MNRLSKYFFYLSILLNSALLMYVAGIIPFLLYVSVGLNVLLTWLTFKSMRKSNNLERDLITIMTEMESFLTNLEDIHAMEMYYGDKDLQNLINSSKMLINNFIDVQEKYFDVEVEFEPEDTEEETKEE